MKVLNKKAFRLPFIERSKFVTLMRLGLGFDKTQGAYRVENHNEVEKIIDVISDIFEGEEISFLQTCILCGKDFPCSDCKYNPPCETKNLPLQCICPSCLKNTKPYDRYAERGLGAK